MSENERSALSRAVAMALRPLVRLALRRGMAFGQFSELVKRAYVEVARDDFAVPGRKPSISRLSVLTGLTRKEAKRVLEAEPGEEAAVSRRRINRAARVVTAWVQEPGYSDAGGRPLSLPFESDEGPSFSSLVRDHGADVTPRAVLDELLRVGTAETLDDGRVHLLERAYIPQADEAEKLAILGTDVSDLVAAIEHNLDRPEERPFYQRKVAYDNLPRGYLDELQALVRARAQELLESLDAEMGAHDRDVARPHSGPTDEEPAEASKARSRAMVGIYYFQETSGEDDEPE